MSLRQRRRDNQCQRGLAHGYFSIIATTYTQLPWVSHAIDEDIKTYGNYERVVDTHFYDGHYTRRLVVYVRTPAGAKGAHGTTC